MSQADMSEVAMSKVDSSGGSGISLASVTAGVLAAVFFLLISSYVSNDASWNIPSDRAWLSTSLTGNDLSENTGFSGGTGLSVNMIETPVPARKLQHINFPNDEAAHFSDALYSADFMNSFAEPT